MLLQINVKQDFITFIDPVDLILLLWLYITTKLAPLSANLDQFANVCHRENRTCILYSFKNGIESNSDNVKICNRAMYCRYTSLNITNTWWKTLHIKPDSMQLSFSLWRILSKQNPWIWKKPKKDKQLQCFSRSMLCKILQFL